MRNSRHPQRSSRHPQHNPPVILNAKQPSSSAQSTRHPQREAAVIPSDEVAWGSVMNILSVLYSMKRSRFFDADPHALRAEDDGAFKVARDDGMFKKL